MLKIMNNGSTSLLSMDVPLKIKREALPPRYSTAALQGKKMEILAGSPTEQKPIYKMRILETINVCVREKLYAYTKESPTIYTFDY